MTQNPPKIAFVTPWFGNGNGGAEVFCGGLAAAVQALGHQVEILTGCCRDPFHDWSKNHLPPGESQVDGVTVRRFRVRPRDASLYAHLYGIIDRGGSISETQEEELLRNSINSDELYRYIDEHREEYLFFFMPYLYGTTYYGLKMAGPERGFLIPCLHNEAFAYLNAMQSMFRRAKGCLFLSQPERDFASTIYDLTRCTQFLLGGGVKRDITGEAPRFRQKRELSRPYVLFVGRKVPGKGADVLLDYFAKFMKAYPDEEMDLVLLGGGELEIAQELRGRVHSFVPDSSQEIYDAMAGCELLCHPSFYESFSLVMMEAWLQGRPVLVNGQCEVTLYHVLKSNGGLYFNSFGEFAETIRLLRQNPVLAGRLGQAGRRYVLENYSWYATAERFQNFLARVHPHGQELCPTN